MKRGDIVKYHDPRHRPLWTDRIGVIVKQVPGRPGSYVVYWSRDGTKRIVGARNLEVINETR